MLNDDSVRRTSTGRGECAFTFLRRRFRAFFCDFCALPRPSGPRSKSLPSRPATHCPTLYLTLTSTATPQSHNYVIHTHIHTYMHTYIHAFILHTYMHKYIHTCMHPCMRMHEYTHRYTQHTYIRARIHTFIHIHT